MDIWHWTPLVALLCYAGLRAIPAAYYQAAAIDGASRWAVFRFIELPKMRGVLTIAVLLRFMDSFMIYTEPFVVTGGGPGNTTTFLSIHLTKIAVGQFDLGPAAAFSIVYFLSSCAQLRLLQRDDPGRHRRPGMRVRTCGLPDLLPVSAAADLLAGHHVAAAQRGHPERLHPGPGGADARQLPHDLHRPVLVQRLHQLVIYVAINMVLSLGVALPAAYAFSRYKFLGDKHMFFWLLTNRMAPPAVFLLPFFQLYQTSACSTRTSPWRSHTAVQRAARGVDPRGFMSGVPKEIDETAYLDGYRFPRFFLRIFLPLIRSGVGVTAFFCFMFSWVELLLARTLTTVNAKPIAATMTRTVWAAGMDWGTLAAAGVLTILPGALVIWFVRNYIAKGFALGRV